MSLGVGVLASCATAPPPPPPHTVAVQPLPPLPPPKPPARRVIPRPGRKPTPPPFEGPTAGADGEAMAMAEPPPAAPPPAAAQPPRASELVGLDQSAATRLFGRAAEQSEEPPATVWRYRTPACELDLFFYLDLRSGRMRTLRYALKGGAGDQSGQQAGQQAGQQDCLRSLAVARAG